MDQDKFGSFYSTICHVCKSMHYEASSSDPLKMCQGCKLVSYCSIDHQKQHWTDHKYFCKTIQRLMKSLKVDYIYENAAAICSSEEWCELRAKVKALCEITLKRSLSACESEMLYFPSVCVLCHKYNTTNMKICSECKCVSYCSVKHLNEDAGNHSKSCKELKIGFDLDLFTFHDTLPSINLDFGERNICQSAHNFCTAFMKFASQSNKLSNPVTNSIYFTLLSCPLTFIHSVFQINLHLFDKLVVHLVGSSNFETQHLAMWDVVFHWLPNLEQLHLVLIGPDVFATSEITICAKCEQAGYKLTVEFCPGQLYHDYGASSEYTIPDMIIMFNCGLSEFIGGREDIWQGSIPCIMSAKCPVIVTSYTAREAESDINRLLAFNKDMTVLIRCKKNTFSGKKPMRDWEQFTLHSESPVFYHNAFISTLIPKII